MSVSGWIEEAGMGGAGGAGVKGWWPGTHFWRDFPHSHFAKLERQTHPDKSRDPFQIFSATTSTTIYIYINIKANISLSSTINSCPCCREARKHTAKHIQLEPDIRSSANFNRARHKGGTVETSQTRDWALQRSQEAGRPSQMNWKDISSNGIRRHLQWKVLGRHQCCIHWAKIEWNPAKLKPAGKSFLLQPSVRSSSQTTHVLSVRMEITKICWPWKHPWIPR